MTGYGLARCPCCGVELAVWYDELTGASLSIPVFNTINGQPPSYIRDFMTNPDIYGLEKAIQASDEATLRMLIDAQNSIPQQEVIEETNNDYFRRMSCNVE